MKFLISWVLVLGPLFAFGQSPSPRTSVVKLNGHAFTLPEGFTIELAAKAPLVDRPVSASFDDQGRLYVTISSGSNSRGPQQAEEKSHHVVRLEDTDGDGVFDKSVVYADKIAMPQGALWHQGSFYVAAPPHIWKFTDTDGDGKADKREIWHQGTVTGCMNDLHGPWLGPDGWIYWTKGAFAEQTYKVHGKDFTTRACHLFRARPDGTGLEPLMTGGMDNPVGLAFTPTGDRIVSGTFFQFPADGKRDGLIHAVYGGIFGKDHDPIRDPIHKWTSPHVLPIMTHLGAAAPCGMMRFESHLFGKEYQDNLFCCLFNMQKVTRHVLIPDGATYKTQDSDFVVSDQKDFHPTDVIEDADGSLLVIDTGGWYKICCPTSQLVKPGVFGAIYRVRKAGAEKLADPYGKKVDWKQSFPNMCNLLKDARVIVKRKAIENLGGRGIDAIESIENTISSDSPEASRNAVWAASRNNYMEPSQNSVSSSHRYRRKTGTFAKAFQRKDLSIIQVALHCMNLEMPAIYWSFREIPGDMHAIRLSAELAGRIGSTDFLNSVVPFVEKSRDTFLDHAITLAFIQVKGIKNAKEALQNPNASVRRMALTALDQIDAKVSDSDSAIKELDAADPQLRETAWWIVSRHPEWADKIAGTLESRFQSDKLTAQQRDDMVSQLAKLAKSPFIQKMLATCAMGKGMPTETRQAAFKAMNQAALKETPESWLKAISQALETREPVRTDAVQAAYGLRLPKGIPDSYFSSLLKVGTDEKVPTTTRLTALAAITVYPGPTPREIFDFLRVHLLVDQLAINRTYAATALSRQKHLTTEQLLSLAETLPDVSPLELDRVLDVFTTTKDDLVGEKLLASLRSPKLKAALRVDMVKTRLVKFSPGIQKQAESLYAELNADLGKQQARLDDLFAKTKSGDIARGQAIFNSQKTACVVCHSMGYLGGKVGPDLTKIGGIRTERDLLEAIVFPSASFVRSYEPVLIVTTSGKTHNGLIKRDTPAEVILVTGPNQEVRLNRDEIEEVQPSKVSVMPAGLDQQLSVQDLADLVAFLKACK